MDIFTGLINGFSIALMGTNILFCFLGALIGTAIGVLPGLGPAATIALLLPMTYVIGSPVTAIIMMAGIYYGAMYGGSTTSILLNLPGEAASVVTCIDGYQMAKKGRAGAALGIAAIGSFIAGTVAVVGLTFFAPPLAEFALDFGPPEYFALTTLGLLLAVTLSGGSIIKGLIILFVGLLLAMVGLDPISGKIRFTFGSIVLQGGFDFVTLAMGVFGLGEILYNLESTLKTEIVTTKLGKLFPTLKDWADSKWAIFRGSVIGFFIGIIPGGGAVISSLASYAVEKKCSKHPEEFGQGAIQGVAGPESANNAASSSSFIPLLTLGIPGNAAIAMIFAALMIQGITPGPFLVAEHPDVFWGVIASMYHWKRDAPRVESPDGGALGADAPRPLRDPRAHHRPVHDDRRLQRPESGLRHLFNALLRRPRLRDAETELRPGPAAARLRPRSHGRAVAQAVAAHLRRGSDDLRVAADIGNTDRYLRPPDRGADGLFYQTENGREENSGNIKGGRSQSQSRHTVTEGPFFWFRPAGSGGISGASATGADRPF